MRPRVTEFARRNAPAALACIALLSPLGGGAARSAEPSAKDVQVLGRTLGFIEEIPGGTVEIGIVYAADQAASLREVEALKAVIGEGIAAGRVVLTARLIPLDQLGQANGVAGLFVTSTIGQGLAAVDEAARRLHVPTISNGMECVRAGRCALGFTSEPRVEIVINRSVSEGIGVRYLPAFRLLVKEI